MTVTATFPCLLIQGQRRFQYKGKYDLGFNLSKRNLHVMHAFNACHSHESRVKMSQQMKVTRLSCDPQRGREKTLQQVHSVYAHVSTYHKNRTIWRESAQGGPSEISSGARDPDEALERAVHGKAKPRVLCSAHTQQAGFFLSKPVSSLCWQNQEYEEVWLLCSTAAKTDCYFFLPTQATWWGGFCLTPALLICSQLLAL